MMQPQTGIAALPPQPAAAPGQSQGIQAALPAMQPKAMGQQSVPSMSPMLASMDLPQLQQRLQQELSRPSQTPPGALAILAQIDKKQKAAALAKAQADAAAMQAAQQQQGTLKDEILAQSAQYAQPQAMATGGPVAFAGGESVGLQNPEYDEEGLPRTNAERERILQNNQRFAKQQANADAYKSLVERRQAMRDTSSVVPKQMQDYYRSTGRDQPVILNPLTAALPTASYSNEQLRKPVYEGIATPPDARATPRPTGAGAGTPRPPGAAAAPAGAAGAPMPTQTSPDGVPAALEAQAAMLRKQMEMPENVRASQEGLMNLIASQIAERQKEASHFGNESRAARDAAIREASVPMIQSAEGLLGLASGIDTRKGKLMGSLSGGIKDYLAGQRAQKTLAGDKYLAAQEKSRMMQDSIRQIQLLSAERDLAMKKNDFERAAALQKQITDIQLKSAEYKVGRGDKAFERDVEQRKLELQKKGIEASLAAATRPTAQEFLYGLHEKGKLAGFLEGQQGPKTEGAILKEMVSAVAKAPWTLTAYPPDMQAIITQEMRKLSAASGVTDTPPPNAPLLK